MPNLGAARLGGDDRAHRQQRRGRGRAQVRRLLTATTTTTTTTTTHGNMTMKTATILITVALTVILIVDMAMQLTAAPGRWARSGRIVAIFYPFSQFCEISSSLLSLQKQPNTAPNLFQRGVEYGKCGSGGSVCLLWFSG